MVNRQISSPKSKFFTLKEVGVSEAWVDGEASWRNKSSLAGEQRGAGDMSKAGEEAGG